MTGFGQRIDTYTPPKPANTKIRRFGMGRFIGQPSPFRLPDSAPAAEKWRATSWVPSGIYRQPLATEEAIIAQAQNFGGTGTLARISKANGTVEATADQNDEAGFFLTEDTDLCVVCANSYVRAYNTDDLTLEWEQTGLNLSAANPQTLAHGALYVGDGADQRVLSFDVETGRIRFDKSVGFDVDVFATHDTEGYYYASDQNNGVISKLDATTGNVVASYSLNNANRWEGIAYPGHGDLLFAIRDNDGSTQELYAIDKRDMTEAWTAQPFGQGLYSIAFWAGSLYVTGGGAGMAAYRQDDGTQLWADTSRYFYYPRTVDGGKLLVGTGSYSLEALEATDGSNIWTHENPLQDGYYGIIPDNGEVFTATSSGVFAHEW
ncbi:PQQ-binding-like beta-propeller repeat protein [Halorubellus litoreus]|uniref:PQQ-binding-like beta-propeller repeat protein n=1 Tax=Halorubellus litoreus TaxID=755308 RepID=A0ABD5VKW6_9EURY